MKNLLVLLALLLAAAVGYVAMQPSEFRVSRTRTLAAPPEIVHAYVNDFHKWVEWSPWEKIDPALRREYSGAPEGPGAIYEWAGNEQVGEGRMTITGSNPPESVTIQLEFQKPVEASNTAEFYFDRGGLGTDVTWSMTGRSDFVGKAFALFMSMDKMVGADFEKGLAALDEVTAAVTPPPPPPAPEPAPGEETAPAEAETTPAEAPAPGAEAVIAEPAPAEATAPPEAEPAAAAPAAAAPAPAEAPPPSPGAPPAAE
jgi:hypothetical protein